MYNNQNIILFDLKNILFKSFKNFYTNKSFNYIKILIIIFISLFIFILLIKSIF